MSTKKVVRNILFDYWSSKEAKSVPATAYLMALTMDSRRDKGNSESTLLEP